MFCKNIIVQSTNRKRKKKFCNNSCSASYNNNDRKYTNETKFKISKKLKNRKVGGALGKYINGIFSLHSEIKIINKNNNKKKKICIGCQKEFTYKNNKKQRFCSHKCVNENPYLRTMTKPVGGYRPKSGRGKIGHYQNIYYGSTYELAFVIYNLDHQIPFQRFEHHLLREDGKKYFPDFIVNGVINEIKGYEVPSETQAKIKAAQNAGYQIKILYKADLKYCFDHVKQNYKYSKLEDLYQGKKKYFYQCARCETIYETNRKKKRKNTFCSRYCSPVKDKINNKIKNTFTPQSMDTSSLVPLSNLNHEINLI